MCGRGGDAMCTARVGCDVVGRSNRDLDIWLLARRDARRMLVFRGALRVRVDVVGGLESFGDRSSWGWGTCSCRPTGQSRDPSCWRRVERKRMKIFWGW